MRSKCAFPAGLTVACVVTWSCPVHAQKIYWSEHSSINRANLDGTQREKLLEARRHPAQYIAVDTGANNLYTLGRSGLLFRSTIDADNIQRLEGSFYYSSALVVDPASHRLYWSDEGFEHIIAANADGTHPVPIVENIFPSSLNLDPASQLLYWHDKFGRKVMRCSVDGDNVEFIAAVPAGVDRLIVDPVRRAIYWVDWWRQSIYRLDLGSGQAVPVISVSEGSIGHVVFAHAAGHIYWIHWNQPGRLFRSSFDGSGTELLLDLAGLRVEGMALDDLEAHIYLSDVGQIYRTSLADPALELVLRRTIQSPVTLALDWIHGLLYWIDDQDRLQKGTLSGGPVEDLFVSTNAALISPYEGVALDEDGERIFWTSLDLAIYEMTPDGSSLQPVIRPANLPAQLGLVHQAGKIVWTEPDAGTVMIANLDGSAVSILANGNAPRSIAVDEGRGFVYWSDQQGQGTTSQGLIKRVVLTGGESETFITTGDTGTPFTVVIDPDRNWLYWIEGYPNNTFMRVSLDSKTAEPLFSIAQAAPTGIAIDPRAPGDFNHSRTTDLFDFAAFQRCYQPAFSSSPPECLFFDAYPSDGLIDLTDYEAFFSQIHP